MRRVLLTALLSSIALTAAASPVMQLNDASAPTSRPLSTGVTSPRLVYTTAIRIPANELPFSAGNSTNVVLKLDLDETGTPMNIRIIHPVSPEVDARVIEGVRQFRWTPAVLDNKPVPTDLTLTVEVQR